MSTPVKFSSSKDIQRMILNSASRLDRCQEVLMEVRRNERRDEQLISAIEGNLQAEAEWNLQLKEMIEDTQRIASWES